MGAPVPDMQSAEPATAEALLSAFTAIRAPERRRHANVYNYWLAIRGKRDFPALRDFDPLEISDAGPSSVLLQLVSGGEDAEIRHIGETLKSGVEVDRIAEAPRPSLLACLAGKLAMVAISRDALAFEDEFETAAGTTRCQVILLPFSSTGAWVDYVYGFVTLDGIQGEAEETTEAPAAEALELPAAKEPEPAAAEAPEPGVNEDEPEPVQAESEPEPVAAESEPEPVAAEPEPEPVAAEPSAAPAEAPGFSLKAFDPDAGAEGFFGTVVSVEPELVTTSAAQAVTEQPVEAASPLQSKLAEVRAKADEVRAARLRAEAALNGGLGAAYDFALDAEDKADEYLKLVEERGLKVQLRAPMAPVVRLAFEGLCDESTIAELEAVFAWALKMNLPRGSLAARIEAEGGIPAVLGGPAKVR